MYGTQMVAFLNRTATIYLSSNRAAYTPASLVTTYAIREVIVKSTERISTIVAHPIAASARANSELNTVIYRSDTNCSIILVTTGFAGSKDDGKKGNNRLKHCILYYSTINSLSLDIAITNFINPGL